VPYVRSEKAKYRDSVAKFHVKKEQVTWILFEKVFFVHWKIL